MVMPQQQAPTQQQAPRGRQRGPAPQQQAPQAPSPAQALQDRIDATVSAGDIDALRALWADAAKQSIMNNVLPNGTRASQYLSDSSNAILAAQGKTGGADLTAQAGESAPERPAEREGAPQAQPEQEPAGEVTRDESPAAVAGRQQSAAAPDQNSVILADLLVNQAAVLGVGVEEYVGDEEPETLPASDLWQIVA